MILSASLAEIFLQILFSSIFRFGLQNQWTGETLAEFRKICIKLKMQVGSQFKNVYK